MDHRCLHATLLLTLLLPACTNSDPADGPGETAEPGDGDGDGDGDPGDGDGDPGDGDPGDGDGDGDPGDGDGDPAPLEGYDDPALWLCHPDKPASDDQCRANDLTATEVHPDGSTEVLEHVVADDPSFDCFYVYPTVDLRLIPGQTENFNDISQELDPLLNQAARFTRSCRMFAPLYHQVTIGTFGSPEAEALLDAAYQDVEAAWIAYRDHHLGDRPFVIMGHSQGTYMTTRLLQEQIEPDADLRARMIVALMIGGGVGVPEGELVGGTFSELPLCASAEETGCVIAYRTYAEELPPGPGDQAPQGAAFPIACTSAQALLGRPKLGGTYLATFTNQPAAFPATTFSIDYGTPFVVYRDYYSSACLVDPDGNGYLAISVTPEPGDTREQPIDFGAPLLSPDFLGLHVLDYQFVLGDLLDLVELKAAQ